MVALYIHWPFCLHKCPYCDFNSHVRENAPEVSRWAAAYKRELEHYKERLGLRQVTSIFFGGGTPSLMPPALVAEILRHINEQWQVAKDVEITLEANPTSTEAGKFRAFRDAGVNRVSIGVQSLRQGDLAFLGRQHDVKEALKAVQTARDTFPRYSFDLIYARPGQSLAGWEAELDEALSYAGGHLSLYQLTIEKGTPFYAAYQAKAWELPDPELAADMYEFTRGKLAAKGMLDYEISNYAKPGQESQHNLSYWRYGEYVGVGPGAHGRIVVEDKRTATMAIHHPERWLEAVETHGHGLQSQEVLPPEDILSEMLMMGTRLAEGIPRSRFHDLCGAEPEALLNKAKLELFGKEGLLTLDDKRLALTPRGRMLHQRVVGELLL